MGNRENNMKEHLRAQALNLYLKGRTYPEIASVLPVSKQTLCGWAQKYHWKEQRDRQETDLETIIRELRQQLAKYLKELKDGDRVDWDEMSKAASALERLGGINDEISEITNTMDKFTRWVCAQEWPAEKVNIISEATNAFMDKVGEEAFE